MATTTAERTEKGVSLARGPALILGTILEVAGLYFLYKQHGFPKLSNFPNGDAPVPGKVFLGIFGVNGWSGLLTAAAGGVLLFGAAQHLLAKTMSLIVGVALGAAAVIAVISGNVLGLAAANGWTRLGWGVCAVILLFNTMIPRRRRTVQEPVVTDERPVARTRPITPAPTGEPATQTARPAATAEPVTRAESAEPATRTQAAEPATRADTAETEMVAREPEATAPDREGLADADGHAVTDSEAETTQHRPVEE
jgi:hypothetical protein